MSRSEEKAKASLNRWKQFSANIKDHGSVQKRPEKRIASDCNSLTECENVRKRLVDQIQQKIEKIQQKMPVDQCKQLNDEINKLFRVKFYWERQIRALGGPDYRQQADSNAGGVGYMYFGSARELPEVKAFLKKKESEAASDTTIKTQHHLKPIPASLLTHEYYGFDQEEEEMLDLEAKAEQEAIKMNIQELDNTEGSRIHWDESWKVPTKEEIDQALLDFRKAELIKKYAM